MASVSSPKRTFSTAAIIALLLWYIFSFLTLFANKHILTSLSGEPTLLGAIQMLMTAVCGGFHLYFPCGLYTSVKREALPSNFYRNMMCVGTLRFLTVVFGLSSLKYVPVSFTETVKSSAPMFTVIIAWIFLGERTGPLVAFSLLPIMVGLGMCTAYELSFEWHGFLFAVATNLSECTQNVASKMLISGDKFKYTPAEMQFYTGAASMLVQIPVLFLTLDISAVRSSYTTTLCLAVVVSGFFYHLQTITEYALLQHIPPVTHSVANTVKRALLIWISIFVFGNTVTISSAIGIVLMTFGVGFYTYCRELEAKKPILVLEGHRDV